MAKSEKDTVRLNSAETRPRGPGARGATGIGPTGPGPGRNHSSADLLLLISIKFNPARLAVGGAFTSCNSCLPLWSFSRGVPHALSETPASPSPAPWTDTPLYQSAITKRNKRDIRVNEGIAADIERSIVRPCLSFVYTFPLSQYRDPPRDNKRIFLNLACFIVKVDFIRDCLYFWTIDRSNIRYCCTFEKKRCFLEGNSNETRRMEEMYRYALEQLTIVTEIEMILMCNVSNNII